MNKVKTYRGCSKIIHIFLNSLHRFCPLFPFQSNLTKALVEDHSLNVKVLLLVRDPRGTIQSRKHRVRVMWWG